MEKQAILCEYCKSYTPVLVGNYRKHVLRVHNIQLDINLDFSEKIKADSEIIKKKFPPNAIAIKQIKEQAEKEKIKELERKRQDYIDANTTCYSIIWEDIFFDQNKIKFEVKRLNTILSSIPLQGVFKSLNEIKVEYFLRLFPKKIYKLYFFKGELVFSKSPDWIQIIKTIEVAKDFHEFKYSRLNRSTRVKRFNSLKNEEIIRLFETSFIKSEYLKFLAKLQSSEYKLIPVLEFISNHSEESFLFRLVTKNDNILLVWENVNYARATHIFYSKRNDIEKIVELLEEFICRHDIDMKRSILYLDDNDSKAKKKTMQYLKSVKHSNIDEFIREIYFLIDNK